jgi:hypothetical protein
VLQFASVTTQAADQEPVKAPVQYVKVCSAYGPGFYYMPGTPICIKIGGYVRAQGAFDASGDGIPAGADTMVLQGRRTFVDTNDFNYEARGVVSVDTRISTEFGVLRGYLRSGVQSISPLTPTAAPTVFWDRGFVEFAGLTMGRARSKFDIFGLTDGAITYGNPRTSGDTDLTGVILAAYTFYVGNGVSFSVSAEDPGGHNMAGVTDASGPGFWSLGNIVLDNGLAQQAGNAPGVGGAVAGGSGFQLPDFIVNGRLDQVWGTLGVSGAVHQVAGGYFLQPDSTLNGHPDRAYGWAAGAGGQVNLPMLGFGDTIGAMGVASRGAVGFATKGTKWLLYNGTSQVGVGWGIDGIFDDFPPAPGGLGGTPIELTDAFSVNAAYDHGWNERWRTSVYGGYAAIRYDQTATNMINQHLAGAAGSIVCGVAVGAAVTTPVGGNPLAGNNCSPNYSFWQAGSRTQFTPVPWLTFGVDITYTRLNSAFAGPTAAIAASGAQPGCVTNARGTCTAADQNILSGLARVQLSFLP